MADTSHKRLHNKFRRLGLLTPDIYYCEQCGRRFNWVPLRPNPYADQYFCTKKCKNEYLRTHRVSTKEIIKKLQEVSRSV
ncbi:MAG: hypothetical protein ACTSRS_18995 [Candidatus Helarchaeota archaeon]